jgi:hypothetical protein
MNYSVRMNTQCCGGCNIRTESHLYAMVVVHAAKKGKMIRDFRYNYIKDPFTGDTYVILEATLS